jgi:hypothetical protein
VGEGLVEARVPPVAMQGERRETSLIHHQLKCEKRALKNESETISSST